MSYNVDSWKTKELIDRLTVDNGNVTIENIEL